MALILLAIIAAYYFMLSSPKVITMPDVVDWEYDEAKEELEGLKLKVNKNQSLLKKLMKDMLSKQVQMQEEALKRNQP